MKEWIEKIESADSIETLENLRIEILGKKGFLTKEFARLKDIPNEEKKTFAQNLNNNKVEINNALEAKKEILEKIELNKKLEAEKIDVTRFNNNLTCGAFHPVADTMDRIITYFQNLSPVNFLSERCHVVGRCCHVKRPWWRAPIDSELWH